MVIGNKRFRENTEQTQSVKLVVLLFQQRTFF